MIMKHRQYKQLREIIHGSGIAFVLKAGGSVLSFMLSMLLARKLGVEGAGTYFLAFTIVTLVAAFSRLGMDHALVRFAAICHTKHDLPSLSYLVRTALTITPLIAFFTASILYVIAPWLATSVFDKPILAAPLRLMSFGILFLSLIIVMVHLLKGVKRVRDSQLLEVLLIPGLIILGVLALTDTLGINAAPVSFLLATMITMVVGLAMCARIWRTPPSSQPEISRSLLLKTSLPLLGVTTVNMLTNSAAPLMLGYFATLSDVAIYTAASKAAFLTAILLASVSTIAAPKFATLHARGEKRELERSVRHVNLLLGLIAAPILLGYLYFAEDIMALFGSGFEAGILVLIILSIGQFISVSSGSVGQLLIMCGHQKAGLNIMIAVSIMNILLNLLLVPVWQVVGAAIATSITLVAKNVLAVIVAQRLLGISVLPFIRRGSASADYAAR